MRYAVIDESNRKGCIDGVVTRFDTEEEAVNFQKYMALKFPRYMLRLTYSSMNIWQRKREGLSGRLPISPLANYSEVCRHGKWPIR